MAAKRRKERKKKERGRDGGGSLLCVRFASRLLIFLFCVFCAFLRLFLLAENLTQRRKGAKVRAENAARVVVGSSQKDASLPAKDVSSVRYDG
jgi:hypothetical protein